MARITICREIRILCAIFGLRYSTVLFFTLIPSLGQGLKEGVQVKKGKVEEEAGQGVKEEPVVSFF